MSLYYNGKILGYAHFDNVVERMEFYDERKNLSVKWKVLEAKQYLFAPRED